MKIEVKFTIEVPDGQLSESEANDAAYHVIRTSVLTARMNRWMKLSSEGDEAGARREQFWMDALADAEFSVKVKE